MRWILLSLLVFWTCFYFAVRYYGCLGGLIVFAVYGLIFWIVVQVGDRA